MVLPKPHDSDAHAFGVGAYRPVLQLSADGWPANPEAISHAFGPHVDYGTIIKDYRNARMQYTLSKMVGTERKTIIGQFADDMHLAR